MEDRAENTEKEMALKVSKAFFSLEKIACQQLVVTPLLLLSPLDIWSNTLGPITEKEKAFYNEITPNLYRCLQWSGLEGSREMGLYTWGSIHVL